MSERNLCNSYAVPQFLTPRIRLRGGNAAPALMRHIVLDQQLLQSVRRGGLAWHHRTVIVRSTPKLPNAFSWADWQSKHNGTGSEAKWLDRTLSVLQRRLMAASDDIARLQCWSCDVTYCIA